ncbi:MAG: NIL domain-containing protein [Chloroflexi bacterium]|nr:NIL domain-containing protein [Chloroflexota bacterium]
MVKQRVKFTFPENLIKEPVIYQLGMKFQVVTNIRRADVEESKGWVVLELEGAQQAIDDSLRWVRQQGVIVAPVTGDVIEG